MQCVEELSPEALFDLDEIEAVPVFDAPDFPTVAFTFTEAETSSATACTYSVTVANLEAYNGAIWYAQSPYGEFAIEGYDYWMSAAESGHARADAGGAWDKTVGWSAAAGASIMVSFIDFWDARGIQQQAELSGEYSATEGCEGEAWKHGAFAVGRIGLQGAKVATMTRMARADFAHYPHKRGHKFPHIQFGEWRREVPKVVIDIFKKKVKPGSWPF